MKMQAEKTISHKNLDLELRLHFSIAIGEVGEYKIGDVE